MLTVENRDIVIIIAAIWVSGAINTFCTSLYSDFQWGDYDLRELSSFPGRGG